MVVKKSSATNSACTPEKMEFTLGSGSKTRLLGGSFSSKENHPVKITFSMRGNGGTEMEIIFQDNLSFHSTMVAKTSPNM